MARIAVLMDRIMESFGLSGKSFIPMIIGFGCNVPSIMAARSIENEKERLTTILIAPFMSCSAQTASVCVVRRYLFQRESIFSSIKPVCFRYYYGIFSQYSTY